METNIIQLPEPNFESNISIEKALLQRKSVRNYTDAPLSLAEISQILWSAQRINIRDDGKKGRTAPSAGALYPLKIYLTVNNVTGLEPGVYSFIPEEHKLSRVIAGNVGIQLKEAAQNQPWVLKAPINIVIGAIYERTTGKYGDKGIKFVHMEVGHVGQNIYLQVISLGLGTLVVGAFDDNKVRSILNLEDNVTPLYIMPVGRPTSLPKK